MIAVDEADRPGARARLEAIEGVLRAWADDAGVFWVVAVPEAAYDRLRAEVDEVLREAVGDGAEYRLVAPMEGSSRVTFRGVERERLADGNVRVRVVLSWRGVDYAGEATGEHGEPLEVRTTAGATLLALSAAAGRALGLRLVGVKQMRAFDADLVIVSILSADDPPRRLVGSVAATSGPHHAAAIAVLDACNRYLGQHLNRTD